MAGKKKERFPCQECGRITGRNIAYDDLNGAYLCEGCRNLYRNNPVCHIPPIGEVHFDKNDKIICHVCGRGNFDKLISHVKQRHGLSAMEYREKFGLNRTQPLTSKSYRKECQDRGKLQTERLLTVLANNREATQFKKGCTLNKGRKLSPQAVKNLERKRSEGTAVVVTNIFRKKRLEAERQRKLQEQMENQD